MAPPKTCGSTTARLDHPNTDETEKSDLKSNFRKMIAAIKAEVKNSLKELKGKKNKKLK